MKKVKFINFTTEDVLVLPSETHIYWEYIKSDIGIIRPVSKKSYVRNNQEVVRILSPIHTVSWSKDRKNPHEISEVEIEYYAYSNELQNFIGWHLDLLKEENEVLSRLLEDTKIDLTKTEKRLNKTIESLSNINRAGFWKRFKYLFTRSI